MQRQLFFDDESIAQTSALVRAFHPLTKQPENPIVVAEWPWEGALMPYTVIFDDRESIFKMWYGTFARVAGAYGAWVTCYATSTDGIQWQRPDLGMFEYEGSFQNNLCALDTGLFNVFRDDHEADPSCRFKALYWGVGPQPRPGALETWMDATSGGWGICVAFSPDGIHWTRHPDNPVLTRTGDTDSTYGWDERYGKYVAFIRPGRHFKPDVRPLVPRRVIGRSESGDFVHWTEPVAVMVPDADDPPSAELYQMHVSPYHGHYLGLVHVFVPSPDPYGPFWAELASSRDGIRWRRLGSRRPVIPLGDAGSWDAGMIWAAKGLIEVGEELWVYYSGWRVDHGTGRRHRKLETERVAQRRAAAIGLGRIRQDGFVSLDASAAEGRLLSKPLRCDGEKLVVNARVADGYVGAALLTEDGNPISGFTRADCNRFSGDRVSHVITWGDRAELSSLRGSMVRVEIFLSRAELYSYSI